MRRRGAAAAISLALAIAGGGLAHAGAWPQPAGHAQLILKAEDELAGDAFDSQGRRVSIPQNRTAFASAFLEYGLTSNLTFQGKAAYTDGEDFGSRYSGRGPIEAGLRWTVYNRFRTSFAVYAGALYNGVGQNAAYARPNIGHTDGEVRALIGQSEEMFGHETFADLEVARLFRTGGLANENHFDLTLGVYATKKWLVLLQSYSGFTDGTKPSSDWVKLEGGLVRHIGPWSAQAGWRGLVYGRNTPISTGPVIAIWRRF